MTESDTGPRLQHRTPVEPIDPTRWEPKPAGDDAGEALEVVTAEFTRFPNRDSSRVFTSHSLRVTDGVLLFRLAQGWIHVVGDGSLAGQMRHLLGQEAIEGWRLHPLPETRTPLQILANRLTSRFYNLLARNGFTTAEEVAATPEECLLGLRGAGEKFVSAVRDATTDLGLGLP